MNRETYNRIFNEGAEGYNPYATGSQDTVHNLRRARKAISAAPAAKRYMWNNAPRTLSQLNDELASLDARLVKITDAFAIKITAKKRDELSRLIITATEEI